MRSTKMRIPALLTVAVTLGSCTATGPNPDPVPGSLIYGGQPSGQLTKAPVGSTLTHRFYDDFAQEWEELYRIQPDRSLTLVRRTRINYPQD
ncbi:MAG TPA: hypothetical protein VGO22_02115 [Pseudorhizobium sp.]|nr:hypothetical protein [Pseudorhizobium sp.]